MKETIAIIGGGTAGLFLAAFLDSEKFDIHIYDQKPALGRKFLVAGDGGFNLTHSENVDAFKQRYTPTGFVDNALNGFTNSDFRGWLSELGVPTFVGTSKRVYPEKGIKPIQVLKTILNLLENKGVQLHFGKNFTGWNSENKPVIDGSEAINANKIVFALGGSSWKVTGSDGSWHEIFAQKGIEMVPFRASNCAFGVDWPVNIKKKHGGVPLKNIQVNVGAKSQKGELVLTEFGLEGNAIYAMSEAIQNQLTDSGQATISIDFKPNMIHSRLVEILEHSSLNTSTTLRKTLKLSSLQVDLIKSDLSKEAFMSPTALAENIKAFPIRITKAAPIDEAISTLGGISLKEISNVFELKSLPNQYCIGEMLDWNAPTGGYLIQACVSMGNQLAAFLNKN